MSNTERVQGQMLRFSDYADMQSRGIEEAKLERNFWNNPGDEPWEEVF